MITLKQEEKLLDRIKALTELELTTLIQELKDHFRKNHLNHVFDDITDNSYLQDQVYELEEKVDSLEEKLEEATSDAQHWEDKADQASKILLELIDNEHGEDQLNEKLNKAYNILS